MQLTRVNSQNMRLVQCIICISLVKSKFETVIPATSCSIKALPSLMMAVRDKISEKIRV